MAVLDETRLLRRLARLFNVQTAHYDGFGRLVQPSPEALLSVLRTLGASTERPSELASAFRERRQALWGTIVDPVTVVWESNSPQLALRLPRTVADRPANYEITLEDGARLSGQCLDERHTGEDRTAQVLRRVEGIDYVRRRLTVPEKPPLGYHRLCLTIGDVATETQLIIAPLQGYSRGDAAAKSWGVFCPVYALASANSWGIGDFTDLESLVHLSGALGARAVSTLPLLAAFLDEPYNPSPYAPVSRFFWNELFLDVFRIPELQNCPEAKSLLDSSKFRQELQDLRASRYIDYRRTMSLKRGVLETLIKRLLTENSQRRTSFDQYVATHPMAQDYAAFRAKTERERAPWARWRQGGRDGTLSRGDYDEAARQYHLYVQWQADEQMGAFRAKPQSQGSALYLDFPLGVNRDGYDVWREVARHQTRSSPKAKTGASPHYTLKGCGVRVIVTISNAFAITCNTPRCCVSIT
jgi:4-alpha-glucanotransferase